MSYQDCFDCFRLRPDRCDAHTVLCDLCGHDIGYGTSNRVNGELYCEDCYYLAQDCGYDDDFGPADSLDPPDRDEYEPGGRYFDHPSLEDHPQYFPGEGY
jgi:hypothetical protein